MGYFTISILHGYFTIANFFILTTLIKGLCTDEHQKIKVLHFFFKFFFLQNNIFFDCVNLEKKKQFHFVWSSIIENHLHSDQQLGSPTPCKKDIV